MRVSDSSGYRSLLNDLSTINGQMQQASSELSSGKRLTSLHVAPADSAEMVRLNDQLAQIDQFQTNSDQSSYYLQVSDSALNSVYDLITAIYSQGSAATTGTNDSSTQATLATEIRAQRDQILSLANTQLQGRYLFAGSKTGSAAFTINGDTAQYQGDDEINTINISNGLSVQANIAGSSVFTPVLNAVESLLTAIDSGDKTAISSALSNFSGAMSAVSKARTTLGVDLSKIQDASVARTTQKTNVATRQSHIGDADMADAISRLSQSQTTLQAALNAGTLINKTNLFDYMV